MTAAYLPGPADKYGPCADPCKHLDCAETRALQAQTCRICEQAMGAGVYFYSDPDSDDRCKIDHASCLETVEARARQDGIGT